MEVPTMPRPKGSKNKPKTVKATVDFAAQIAEKQAAKGAKAAESAKKAEAEDVLKKLLASGVSADEILAKLK